MPFTRPLILLLLVLLVMVAVFRWQPEAGVVSRSQLMMGTFIDITAYGDDQQKTDALVTAAFTEMARIEQLMSSHVAGSDVVRLADVRVGEVAAETAEVIQQGLDVARRSGGAFDLSLGRLKQLWGLESERPRVPSAEEIRLALAGTGPKALHLEGRQVVKQAAGALIDLGGIAKGYAVDRAVDLLRSGGMASAAINAGGDMYLLGAKEGRPWRIGIQHPRQSDALLLTLEVEDAAVVTSGDYERFFEQDGTRYHHLFDPQSGYPGRLCQSVTVVADTAARADALATAVFILGPEKGLALLTETPGAEGVLVAADGTVLVTDGLQGKLIWPGK